MIDEEASFSQNETDSVEILNKSSSLFSSTPASVKKASNNLRIGGNFRFFCNCDMILESLN